MERYSLDYNWIKIKAIRVNPLLLHNLEFETEYTMFGRPEDNDPHLSDVILMGIDDLSYILAGSYQYEENGKMKYLKKIICPHHQDSKDEIDQCIFHWKEFIDQFNLQEYFDKMKEYRKNTEKLLIEFLKNY